MALTPLPANAHFGAASVSLHKAQFSRLAPTPLENAPLMVKPLADLRPASAVAGVTIASTANKVLGQVNSAQARMDEILKLAESGKMFSAAELLSLQTHVYRASQELDLAGKVVEKATGGVKQVLQTQV